MHLVVPLILWCSATEPVNLMLVDRGCSEVIRGYWTFGYAIIAFLPQSSIILATPRIVSSLTIWVAIEAH
mgnify:FL=1|jgi:hypothetical protein